MGIFDGLAGASVTERGEKYPQGAHLLEVRKFLVKNTQKAGTCVIVEFVTLASDTWPEGKPTPGGAPTHGSWVQSLNNRMIALQAIKEFFLALYGINKSDSVRVGQVSQHMETMLEQCAANPDTNDLIGRRIQLRTNPIVTQKGFNFMRHDWIVVVV